MSDWAMTQSGLLIPCTEAETMEAMVGMQMPSGPPQPPLYGVSGGRVERMYPVNQGMRIEHGTTPHVSHTYDHHHLVTVWTSDRVLFIGYYDTNTWVQSVPRHPVAHCPEYVGCG